jgi:hypothetical protein
MAVLPYESLARRVLTDLSAGRCAALVGLSNTGKSTLMRALSGQTAERMYTKLCGRRSVLIYVDCNRAVAISAQGFYEVVLRSLLEALADQVALDINATLRAHHQEVTDATTAFNASLSFNLALTDLCEHLGAICASGRRSTSCHDMMTRLLSAAAMPDRPGVATGASPQP